jgi:hypothetical protein
MKYIPAILLLIVLLFSSALSVNAATRQEALNSGYHTTLYTSYLQTLDDTLNAVSVWPRGLQIGGGSPAVSMTIIGDASGNYTFNTVPANSRFYFSDPVNINSVLLVQNGVNALRYCDMNGANCINGSTIPGMYANISSLQNFRRDIYNNVTDAQTNITYLRNRVNTILPTCASGTYLYYDGSVWTCRTPASGTSLPTCNVGEYLYWDGAWSCRTPSSGVTLPSCSSNQVLYWNGAAWGCLTTEDVPACSSAGQVLVWNAVSGWVCTTPAISPTRTCTVVGEVLTWSATGWICQKPSGGTTLPSSCGTNEMLYWNGAAYDCGFLNLFLPNCPSGTVLSTTTTGVPECIPPIDPRFTINAAGQLCYYAPSCTSTSTICTNKKSVLTIREYCDFSDPALLETDCIVACQETEPVYACDGRDNVNCPNVGGVSYWQVTNSGCEGANVVQCDCEGTPYLKATYTPSLQRCLG